MAKRKSPPAGKGRKRKVSDPPGLSDLIGPQAAEKFGRKGINYKYWPD